MAEAPSFQPPGEGEARKWVLIALGVAVLLALVWFVYGMLSDVTGVEVKQAPPTAIDMLPPPPPPPPPPPQPQEKPPEPLDQPDPAPVPEPAPQPDKPAPAPMQIDGPAQAGADSYGMQSGGGGGMGSPGGKGTCVGPNCGGGPPVGVDRFWGRNLANALERHIQNNRSVNVDSFVSEYDVWVNSAGALTQARLVKGSGNGKLDQTVLALLQTATGLRPPPASIRMPQRIKVGRKRF